MQTTQTWNDRKRPHTHITNWWLFRCFCYV